MWVRINGQEELRSNVRRAVREAGLTQAAAAGEADMSPHRLTGFLGSNIWWEVTDVDAIARVLCAHEHDVTREDLIGKSIFRSDRRTRPDAFWAFDFQPWKVPSGEWATVPPTQEDQNASVKTRALCCDCGHLRQVAVRNGEAPESGEAEEKRWTLNYHCSNCGKATPHAILRFGEHRDLAEERDHAPTRAELARTRLQALIDLLAGFNVDLHFRSQSKKSRDRGYLCRVDFDKAKSRWRIEVDPNVPPAVQVGVVENAWAEIATDNFGDIHWDPRTTGTLYKPGDKVWARAADDLVADMGRFMLTERRKMADHFSQQTTQRQADH